MARILASYLAPRNLVLGGAALLLRALRAWRPLSLVLLLNALVQVLDALLGLVRLDVAQTASPAVIAVVLLAASAAVRPRRVSPVTAAPATAPTASL